MQVWDKADASLMDKCLASDVELIQPVLGHVFRGLDMCKDLVQKHYAKVSDTGCHAMLGVATIALSILFVSLQTLSCRTSCLLCVLPRGVHSSTRT